MFNKKKNPTETSDLAKQLIKIVDVSDLKSGRFEPSAVCWTEVNWMMQEIDTRSTTKIARGNYGAYLKKVLWIIWIGSRANWDIQKADSFLTEIIAIIVGAHL